MTNLLDRTSAGLVELHDALHAAPRLNPETGEAGPSRDQVDDARHKSVTVMLQQVLDNQAALDARLSAQGTVLNTQGTLLSALDARLDAQGALLGAIAAHLGIAAD